MDKIIRKEIIAPLIIVIVCIILCSISKKYLLKYLALNRRESMITKRKQ